MSITVGGGGGEKAGQGEFCITISFFPSHEKNIYLL